MKRYDELWLHSEPVEQDRIRELLGDALGTEPDMRLDPDALLTQAQRRERRLRVASVCGAAAAVAAVTVGLAIVTSSAGSEPTQDPSPHLVPGASIEQEPARSSQRNPTEPRVSEEPAQKEMRPSAPTPRSDIVPQRPPERIEDIAPSATNPDGRTIPPAGLAGPG
jgi:hypothetical protein